MQSKWTLPLAVAAGFLGGLLSSHIHLPAAQAQNTTQTAPEELRTQKLVLLGPNGQTLGVLTGMPAFAMAASTDPRAKGRELFIPDGRIHLYDGRNKEIWNAPQSARMTPLSSK